MTQNDPIAQALRSKIEQAIAAGHVHYDAAGQLLPTAEQVVEKLLLMEQVISLSPKPVGIERIDQYDFALPLNALKLAPEGQMYVPKDKLLDVIN